VQEKLVLLPLGPHKTDNSSAPNQVPGTQHCQSRMAIDTLTNSNGPFHELTSQVPSQHQPWGDAPLRSQANGHDAIILTSPIGSSKGHVALFTEDERRLATLGCELSAFALCGRGGAQQAKDG